jgi:hypothetical protein
VAILPTSGATINVTASDGSKDYGKTLATTKTYAAGNGYNVTWNMSEMTTITWNSSNISDLDVSGTYAPDTKEGITLSANADQICAMWNSGYDSGISFSTNASGGFTFSNTLSKNFTKIEMTLNGPAGWDYCESLGTGWSYSGDPMTGFKVTWTGNASTVNLLTDDDHFYGSAITSIAFFLE